MLVRGNLLKEMKENKGVGAKSLLMEIDFLLNKLKHPYPVTKWTRKAEHLPKVKRYMNWRKENKKPTVVDDGGKTKSIHP